jgi:predicted dehydrogenase
MFHHESGATGNLIVNWSDETYRRPFNRVEIQGTQGKIIADRQEYKIYLKEAQPDLGLRRGWNVRYLTDLIKGTYFELRGTEYTNQLARFVESMIHPTAPPVCTFEDALHTDEIIERIFKDCDP